ncbi:MarR family transcriptional regulator [Streptomyces sp. NPDC005395]|uniref:MarR family winged helix-turn-helix transcriptional regulator n=1 Tax=Streptomyces sp. NPDC005395 TaxID=3157042 RepID=UPI0033B8B036
MALHGRLEAAVRAVLRERCDLSVREFTVLLALLRHEHGSGPRMHQLIAAVSLSPSAVTRLMSRLEERELVTRTHCTVDRRGICPALTPGGRILARQLWTPASEAIRQALTEAGCQPDLVPLAQAVRRMGVCAVAV